MLLGSEKRISQRQNKQPLKFAHKKTRDGIATSLSVCQHLITVGRESREPCFNRFVNYESKTKAAFHLNQLRNVFEIVVGVSDMNFKL